ncbi:MAG: anti-sigma factor family protein [Pyrinomonadaceae bacterium]
MNCEECKNLISPLLDNELDKTQAIEVRTHLGLCADCQRMCEEFTAIMDASAAESSAELLPPNSQALWCRINNIIESEAKPEPAVETAPQRGRFFQMSWTQLAAALVCIAVISSLLTVVAIRNYSEPPESDLTARSSATQTTFEKVLSRVGLMETPQQARQRRLREQNAAIDYWDTRVQTRRAQWDRATREAFDRNLQVINDSVNEYTLILEQNPEDDLSGEMLDSVLSEKVNLLRDFADL